MEKQSFITRLKHGWNVFMNRDPTEDILPGPSYTYRPDRVRPMYGGKESIVNTICNRIAVDVAAVTFYHCKQDDNERFVKKINSDLNTCITVEANTDQSGRAFMQDVVASLLDEGCVAVVPIETDVDPKTGSYKIYSMRTGKVLEWFPQHVRVQLYNERSGRREEIIVPKKTTAIIENPFYAIMNERNSTVQRLKRKLALLDAIDENLATNKLDMVIQLPYVIRTEARRKEAEKRRTDIEMQLSGSRYGIAYTDGTEKITQLNRPVENNLQPQIEYLTKQVFSQLGLTDEILNGTANEQTMLNYNNRVIEPIVSAIVAEFNRKFLTKTARTQGQAIAFKRDPFRLVPVNNLAEIADKFTRNEIMTSNEIRAVIGLKPAEDPKADELRNSNINQTDPGTEDTILPAEDSYTDESYDDTESPMGSTDTLEELLSLPMSKLQ